MNLFKVEIETERLQMVPMNLKFDKEIFKEVDENIARYMRFDPPKTIKDTRDFIKESIKKLDQGTDLGLAIIMKNNDEFVGAAGMHHLDNKIPEIGLWIKKSLHSKGLGKEVVNGLIDWARKNLKVKKIKYMVDKNNIPSINIVESLGGELIREFKEKKRNQLVDELEYNINIKNI